MHFIIQYFRKSEFFFIDLVLLVASYSLSLEYLPTNCEFQKLDENYEDRKENVEQTNHSASECQTEESEDDQEDINFSTFNIGQKSKEEIENFLSLVGIDCSIVEGGLHVITICNLKDLYISDKI